MATKTCFLVLGMHRSGTSALTRVLNLLGATLPTALIGPNRGNEKGHWEPIKLVAFNDRVLAECGSSWDDISGVEISSLPQAKQTAYRKELTRLLKSEYGDSNTIVIKDPRICKIADLYLKVLKDEGFDIRVLIPFRNPLEVAHSLAARDQKDIVEGVMLWLKHILDVERLTREEARIFISFDGLLTEPHRFLKALSKHSPNSLPWHDRNLVDEALGSLDVSERKQKSSITELSKQSITRDWADGLLRILEKADFKNLSRTQLKEIDKLRESTELGLHLASVTSEALRAEIRREKEIVKELEAQKRSLDKINLDHLSTNHDLQQLVDETRAHLKKTRKKLRDARAELRQINEERDRAKALHLTSIEKAQLNIKSDSHQGIEFDASPLVSVIIPVKNGLPEFENVLDALKTQVLDHPYEVIILDSGSKDGSMSIIPMDDPRFRLVEIDPRSFGHGKTRNLGAKLARGEYCAFLTHDAAPVDDFWLQELVKPLREDEQVAGVFGRHIAYEGATPFTKWELETHFEGLKNWKTVSITDAREYVRNQGLRQIYHFYSDNSSCFRKSIWEKYPYPDVNFAEDQMWAKQIVEAGYKKAYAWDSVVYHSHDYSIWERFQRSYDEALALNQYFGYELCPTKKQLLGQTWRTTIRDLGLAFKNGWWLSSPIDVMKKPFDNFARQLGYYMGSTKSEFAKKYDQQFSRDRQLQAK